MDAKIWLIYDAIRGSYGKGTASLGLRNTDPVINSEYCKYEAVLREIQHIDARIRLNFDSLPRSVIVDPGMYVCTNSGSFREIRFTVTDSLCLS
jgi:hypothetical protein